MRDGREGWHDRNLPHDCLHLLRTSPPSILPAPLTLLPHTAPSTMLSPLPLFVSLAVGAGTLASGAVLPVARQAPNLLYPGDPVGQTASWNLTAFVLPISKSLAQSMSGGHKLLPPRGLPAGYIGADQHPLILYGGLEHDIRQLDVTIPNLVVSKGGSRVLPRCGS